MPIKSESYEELVKRLQNLEKNLIEASKDEDNIELKDRNGRECSIASLQCIINFIWDIFGEDEKSPKTLPLIRLMSGLNDIKYGREPDIFKLPPVSNCPPAAAGLNTAKAYAIFFVDIL
jgi:hypothetical protein